MSIFFGVISLNSERVSIDIAKQAIQQLSILDNVYESPTEQSLIFWKNLEIWNDTSSIASEHSLTLLAGNPIFSSNECGLSYDDTLKYTTKNNFKLQEFLSNCNGTFAGLYINKNSNSVHVFSDKLGVRPVYYTVQDGLFIFGTAIWMFEAVSFVKLKPDLNSLAEIAALGYPLSDHTPYREIKAINPAELIEISNCRIKQREYFSWNIHDENYINIHEVSKAVEEAFSLAIQSRLSHDGSETAFLSGGMDSRLIAAHLANQEIHINTLNFAPPGSQDLEFGRQASEALSTNHFELPLGTEEFDDRQVITIQNWITSTPDIKFNKQIWSGDGGSVGLGHVYLSSEIISASINKPSKETINLLFHFNKWGLPLKLLRNKFHYLLANVFESAKNELEKCKRVSPLRAPYFFLLFNDQRRHLAKHFERIHLKNFDFKLPFFDSRLIKTIAQSPTEFFLYHKIYNNILLNLPGAINTIPWQSYPGHIPCPLISNNDANLRYQWDSWHSRSDDRKIELRNSFDCLSFGLNTLLKNSPLNSIRLISAGVLTATKIRNQAYYASYAKPFYKYLHQGA